MRMYCTSAVCVWGGGVVRPRGLSNTSFVLHKANQYSCRQVGGRVKPANSTRCTYSYISQVSLKSTSHSRNVRLRQIAALTLLLTSKLFGFDFVIHSTPEIRDRPKFGFSFGHGDKTGDIFSFGYGRNRTHGFGLLSVTAETTTRFRREPKLSPLAIR